MFKYFRGHYLKSKPKPNDLISRQSAINAVCSVCNAVKPEFRGKKCIHYNEGCEEIEALRKIPSELDWIPVTKKLPEDEGFYLVTSSQAGDKYVCSCFFTPELKNTSVGPWVEFGVTAWMPLPKPYEEENND